MKQKGNQIINSFTLSHAQKKPPFYTSIVYPTRLRITDSPFFLQTDRNITLHFILVLYMSHQHVA